MVSHEQVVREPQSPLLLESVWKQTEKALQPLKSLYRGIPRQKKKRERES